jgi:DnaD/phage-associated family protein
MEKNGGRPKKETTGFDDKKTTGYENKKPNNNVNVNENVNVNNNNNASDSCIDGLQKIIDFYNENIGAITPYGLEILQSYAEEMPVDLIIYAMQISVEANKKTIQYIKAILNNWQKANVKNLADAQRESKIKVKKNNTSKKYTEREYTEEELEELYKNLYKNGE